jgi:hypothetical protein
MAVHTFTLLLFLLISRTDAENQDTLFYYHDDLPIASFTPDSSPPRSYTKNRILYLQSKAHNSKIEFEAIFFTQSYKTFFVNPKSPRYQYLSFDSLTAVWPDFPGDEKNYPFCFRIKEKTPFRLQVRYRKLISIFRSIPEKERLLLQVIALDDTNKTDISDSLHSSIEGSSILFTEK